MLFISFEKWLCTKFHTKNLKASKLPISARFVHIWTVYKPIRLITKMTTHILHDTLLRSIWNFGLLFISSRNDHVQNFTQNLKANKSTISARFVHMWTVYQHIRLIAKKNTFTYYMILCSDQFEENLIKKRENLIKNHFVLNKKNCEKCRGNYSNKVGENGEIN